MKEHYDLEVKTSKIKRNKEGEIIKIKITLEDKKGQKASATFASEDGIPTIKYGNDLKGNLIISSK